MIPPTLQQNIRIEEDKKMGQNIPKVSVIIPVYNAEKYLRECLDSVVNQTLRDIEIICVDDGSTDGSLGILREYEAKDNRVKVLTQQNINAGAARNHGLECASGEYLSFLDADDFFELTMLEHMYKCVKKRNADVVVCRSKVYNEVAKASDYVNWTVDKSLLPKKDVFLYREIEKDSFRCIYGYVWDKLIKRQLITKNQLNFQSQDVFNDAFFAYTALISAESITVLDEYLVNHRYRASKDSITNKRFMHDACSYAFLRELKAFLVKKQVYDQYERDFINYVIHLLYVDFSDAFRDFASQQEMKSKVCSWLDEFHVNEHEISYYYNLPRYQSLLQQVLTREPVRESGQMRRDLSDKVVIPVVYATDKAYMKHVLVSMVSALQYARSNTYYAFYVLIPENSGINASEYDERLSRFDNYSMSFIPVGNEFNDVQMHISHITTPTFFRLRMPGLLKEYDTCIYLDGDTIVCEDLQSLYTIDLQDNYIAGVPAFAYYKNEDEQKKRLGLDKDMTFQYINAGVLLINLKKMREDNIEDQFMRLLDNNYTSQDQDILNVACYGRIQLLPYKYNVMTKYSKYELDSFPLSVVPYDIINGTVNPVIIHYADRIKPWNNRNSPYFLNWLSVAISDFCRDYFSDASSLTNLLSNVRTHNYKSEIDEIHASWSYRIGRFITWIPRKVRGGVRCYREHGWNYTVERFLIHMKLRNE